MNIYFVNRESRWKGPFDVIDARQKHILNIGDLCVRDTDDCLHLLLIENDKNVWTSCKRVGLGNNDLTQSVGNTLLFSFDGIHQRRGDKCLLEIIKECFNQEAISRLLANAIGILEYKEDYWNFELFEQLYNSSPTVFKTVEKDKKISPSSVKKSYPSIFSSYFDDNTLNLFLSYLNNGNTIREAYTAIRKTYPDVFRSALLSFLKENPEKTIYDTFPSGESSTDWFLTDISFTNEASYAERLSPTIQSSRSSESYEPNSDELIIANSNSRLIRQFKDISIHPHLADEQIEDLFRRYSDGDAVAFDMLVRGNLKYVAIVAYAFQGKGIPLEDLIQEGSIGLIYAIRHFDFKYGRPFVDYARLGIKQRIELFICEWHKFVKIPPRHIHLHRLIRQFCDDYEQREKMEPPFEFVEIKGDVSPDFMKPIFNLPPDLQDVIVSKNVWDDVADDSYVTDKKLMDDSDSFDLLRMLHTLPPRTCDILEARYGLRGQPEESLETIGRRLNLTGERVRQISEKGIRTIKEKLSAKKSSLSEATKENLSRIGGSQFNKFSNDDIDEQKPKEKELPTFSKPSFADFQQAFTKSHRPIDPDELKALILHVMRLNRRPMSIDLIANKIQNLPEGIIVRPESVEYLLKKMMDVGCNSDGRYYLKDLFNHIQEKPQGKELRIIGETQSRRKDEAEPKRQILQFPVRLSTPLHQLVEMKILTRKECQHCQHKGLRTIGDVQRMIEKYNLTRESTRFTRYTLDIWFKIVDLLQSENR